MPRSSRLQGALCAAVLLAAPACGGGVADDPQATFAEDDGVPAERFDVDGDAQTEDAASASVSISGVITEMDGPVSGAYVRAYDASGRQLARTRGGSNGGYNMRTSVRPYAITVTAFDHVPRLYRLPALVAAGTNRFRFDTNIGPILGADSTSENLTFMVLDDAAGPRAVPHVAWGSGGGLEAHLSAMGDLLVGSRDRRLTTLIPDGVYAPALESSVVFAGDHLDVFLSEELDSYNLGSAYLAVMIDQIAATASHNYSDQELPVRILVACESCEDGYRPLRDGAVGPSAPGESYVVNPPSPQTVFTDTRGHRYANQLAMAKELGIATGYRDGSDHPNAPVTRAELAAMLIKALSLPNSGPATPSFSDVPSSHWAFRAIQTAKAKNLMNGLSDGKFHPTDPVTRAQLAAYLVNAAGWPAGDRGWPSFADVATNYWAYRRIETAYGWCHSVESRNWSDPTRFEPAAAATRAEAIAGTIRMRNCLVGNEAK